MASAACRDCAQPGFGGPSDNRFTAYDAICRGAGCRAAGIPQAYVNLSNLTLFVQVTDLAFGGPAPAFSFERVFNSDDLRSGPFGPGWTFSLGDALTFAADGSVEVRRGSGRTDTFASVGTGKTFIAVSQTAETLAQNGDGSYTLRNVATGATRVFNTAGKVISLTNGPTVIALEYNSSGQLTTARYR